MVDRKIAIVGAGAMGAAYAAMFTDAAVFSVCFVARGDRYRRLLKQTLSVNGTAYPIPVVRPDEATETADLILVALKHHHLEDALPDMRRLVGDRTIILSVMNGLDSESLIGAVCGRDRVVDAIAVGIDAVREDERFYFASPGRIVFGSRPGMENGDRVHRLEAILDRAAIPCEVSQDIRRTLWWKFMINVGINQASAVLRAPYSVFQTSADARALMTTLMQEVIAVARKSDIGLTEADIDDWIGILATLSPSGKTSMLQDIAAQRKTELDIFAGKVVSMGRQVDVPTPVNEAVLNIIRVLEGGGSRFGICDPADQSLA